jgi:hypothetical protein
MTNRPHQLLAYDANGDVIATLDHVVARDDQGNVVGLVDFEAHEDAGGEHLGIWHVSGAVGSKVWPEWLGGRAHDFRVERSGPPGAKRITALVHRESGHRRERHLVEAAIQARVDGANGEPVNISDLVGGPGLPLHLDEHGRTAARVVTVRPDLPLLAVSSGQQTEGPSMVDTVRDDRG